MLLSLGMLMLSATQLYTIFTVQLFAFLNLLPVEADISAYSLDNKTETFDDLPARFGYRLPSEGLKIRQVQQQHQQLSVSPQLHLPLNQSQCPCMRKEGFLIGARPENACEPIDPPPFRDNVSSAFIVLIKRCDCNFDIKVLNAQKAGYKGAVVHNVDSDDLITMRSNDLDVLKQIDIPSVFVGEDAANSLKEDYMYDKGGHVMLMPDFSLPLEYYLIPFLIIVGICLILIVVFMITKCVQDRHRARRSRLRKDQLKKLPIHKYKKGDSYDVCAICLDEYEEGDKLRVLPCSHAYHCKCVDPWLTKTKKTCPVCKQRVVPSQGDSDTDMEESSHEDNEDDASENTPLLRSLASTSAHSFGTMSGSLSHHEQDLESSEYEEDDDDNDMETDSESEEASIETVVVQMQQSCPGNGNSNA
ncbi:hypothetical protein GJAV_G00114450 [Gymnothorax javanicus]|nr:hypothetical protein GJAV_G00114450 [Gymnothorax javanicus]